jgi:hypothetical protein
MPGRHQGVATVVAFAKKNAAPTGLREKVPHHVGDLPAGLLHEGLGRRAALKSATLQGLHLRSAQHHGLNPFV